MERVRTWLARFTESRKVELSPQQQEAVEMAAYLRVSIITSVPEQGRPLVCVLLWNCGRRWVNP
jgi:exodeoxyribonuclease V alpha subunit